jgi:hypothetical protein
MTEVKPLESGSSPDESLEGQGQVTESQTSVEDLQKEVEGLKQGIQAEREKRQSVEQQTKLMEQLYYSQQNQPQQQPADTFDPDDVATNASVEQMVNAKVQQLQGIQNQMTQQQQMAFMRSQHEDFDQVVGVGSLFDQVQKDTPGLLEFVNNHPQGVELAYKIGQTHPEYQQKLKEKAAQEVVSKAEKNLNKPPSIDSGGDALEEMPDYSKMTDEQIEKEIFKAKGY